MGRIVSRCRCFCWSPSGGYLGWARRSSMGNNHHRNSIFNQLGPASSRVICRNALYRPSLCWYRNRSQLRRRSNVHIGNCWNVVAWSTRRLFPALSHCWHPVRVPRRISCRLGCFELDLYNLSDPTHHYSLLHSRQPNLFGETGMNDLFVNLLFAFVDLPSSHDCLSFDWKLITL